MKPFARSLNGYVQTERCDFWKGTAKNRGLPTETRIEMDRRAVRERLMPVVGRSTCAPSPTHCLQKSPRRTTTVPPSYVEAPAIVNSRPHCRQTRIVMPTSSRPLAPDPRHLLAIYYLLPSPLRTSVLTLLLVLAAAGVLVFG